MRGGLAVLAIQFLAACGQEAAEQTTQQPVAADTAAIEADVPAGLDSISYELRVYPLDSFPHVPAEINAALQAVDCGFIAQTYTSRKPGNVTSGQFAAPGQNDWAALCYRNGRTELTVVWGGGAKCSSRLNNWPASSDRFIAQATMEDILTHAERYGGPQPPARDHDGIHEGVAEKASTIFFCHEGKWHELQGAD
jgi:hypothetical protein